MHDRLTRRAVIGACGAAITTAVSGCLDRGPEGPSSPPGSGTPTAEPPSPPVDWSTELGAPITVPPTVGASTVYAGTNAGAVYGLATESGRRTWSVETDRPIHGRPLVADGLVVAVSGTDELGSDHVLYAFDAETERERWRFAPESWWLEPLGVRDGTLYVGTADDAIAGTGQTLYALAIEAGEERWSAEIGDPTGGVITDDAVYVPAHDRLYAYEVADGAHRWTTALAGYAYRSVAAADGTVCFVAETDESAGGLFAVEAATGEPAWTVDDWAVTSTTLADGVVYAGGEHVAAYELATGERRWRVDDAGFVPRAPVRNGTLFAGGDRLTAYAIADGTRRWTWTPEPAIEGILPAAASAEAVYVDTYRDADPRNRYTFAVDAETGEQRWGFDGDAELTDLVYGDRRAFVGAATGTLYGLAGA